MPDRFASRVANEAGSVGGAMISLSTTMQMKAKSDVLCSMSGTISIRYHYRVYLGSDVLKVTEATPEKWGEVLIKLYGLTAPRAASA